MLANRHLRLTVHADGVVWSSDTSIWRVFSPKWVSSFIRPLHFRFHSELCEMCLYEQLRYEFLLNFRARENEGVAADRKLTQ